MKRLATVHDLIHSARVSYSEIIGSSIIGDAGMAGRK